jgi:ABC-type amino acid transport substrate-binding protein
MNQSVQPSLMISNNNIVNNDLYKTSKPVFKLGTFSNIVFVSKASPIKDMKDLIELSQKRQINFAHGGVGTASHKAMARLCEKTLDCLPVPYKGASQAMLDLLNGTVDTFAVVSYGANSFLQNTSYKSIGKISNDDNWVILFGKNLSNKDIETIQIILNQTNNDFFTEMGFL